MAPALAAAGDFPVDVRSVKALQLQQLKRTFDLFAGNYGTKPDIDTRRYVDVKCWLCTTQEDLCIPCHMLMHFDSYLAVKKPS